MAFLSKKAFYDKDVPSGNWVTTITGIITLIVTILSTVGVLTQEQATELLPLAVKIIEGAFLLVGYVSSIILMFKAKD